MLVDKTSRACAAICCQHCIIVYNLYASVTQYRQTVQEEPRCLERRREGFLSYASLQLFHSDGHAAELNRHFFPIFKKIFFFTPTDKVLQINGFSFARIDLQ